MSKLDLLWFTQEKGAVTLGTSAGDLVVKGKDLWNNASHSLDALKEKDGVILAIAYLFRTKRISAIQALAIRKKPKN